MKSVVYTYYYMKEYSFACVFNVSMDDDDVNVRALFIFTMVFFIFFHISS